MLRQLLMEFRAYFLGSQALIVRARSVLEMPARTSVFVQLHRTEHLRKNVVPLKPLTFSMDVASPIVNIGLEELC